MDKESLIADGARGAAVVPAHDGTVLPMGADGGEGYNNLSSMLTLDAGLMYRYADYENMDDYPELSAALDYYADDTTIPDSIHGKTIWAASRDRLFRDLIDDCLHRRMRIEEDIWPAVRTFCKYGNLFAENVVAENMGLVGLNWLPVPTVRRVVDKRGALLGYVQDTACEFNFVYSDFEKLLKNRDKKDEDGSPGRELNFFYPWEVTHWRLRSKYMRSLYGYSILDSARWIWKRLQMLEDTALVYKLTRSPARYAFYIDTSDLPPKQAMALV